MVNSYEIFFEWNFEQWAIPQVINHGARQGAPLAKYPIVRLFTLQAVVLLLGSVSLLFVSKTQMFSALLGGMIAIVPNIYFAFWAFRYSGAQAAKNVSQSFYRGEAGKFILTAMLFAGVFVLVLEIKIITFFVSYVFLVIVHWLLASRLIK